MKIKQLLPVTYLLLNYKGRIDRKVYWIASLFMWSNFYVFYQTLDYFLGESATWIIYPLMLWGILAVSAKRFHDIGKSGNTILLTLIPIIGPLVVIYLLAFKKGDTKDNQYGAVPGSEIDYYKNDDGTTIPHLKSKEMIINDVTRLNPVIVSEVIRPESVEDLITIIKNSSGPISVGGGRFSMGGQTASPSSTHIDMRKLNQVLEYNPAENDQSPIWHSLV